MIELNPGKSQMTKQCTHKVSFPLSLLIILKLMKNFTTHLIILYVLNVFVLNYHDSQTKVTDFAL